MQKLILSNQLMLQTREHQPLIFHRLNGAAIQASQDLLKFLELFEEPQNPIAIAEEYGIPEPHLIIARLMKMNFLIPKDFDEELQWLHQHLSERNNRHLNTEHCITFCLNDQSQLVREFTIILEKAHAQLLSRGLPVFSRKIIINMCADRAEFQKFWGAAHLPQWPRAFVIHGRILIVDYQELLVADRTDQHFSCDIRHELMHIFLRQNRCHLPIWAEEGLCEFFSQPYNDHYFRQIAKCKKIYGFREIEIFAKHSLLDLDADPAHENICYRQSHSFITFLAHLIGEKKLIQCACATRLSKDFRTSFREITGNDIDALERRWLLDTGLVYSVNFLKTSRNLRIIKTDQKVLAYNSFRGQSLISGPDLVRLLKFFENGAMLANIYSKYDIPGLEETINVLREKQLLTFSEPVEDNVSYRKYTTEIIKSGRLINQLRLNVSKDCNMRCAYCYVDHQSNDLKNMPWTTARKAIDAFFDLQYKHNNEYALIRFFGGEPLLNWSVIEKSIQYAETLRNGIHLDYIINTNGTIASDSMAATLANYNVNVVISLDGIKSKHDRFRKFSSGKGSFEVIDQSLELFLLNGCSVSIATTLCGHKYHNLKALIDYLVNKAAKIKSGRIDLAFQSICMHSPNQFNSTPLNEQIDVIIQSLKYAKARCLSVDNGMLQFAFNAFLDRRPKGVYCRAMGEELTVFPNGYIYPCGALKIKLGTLDSLETVFKSDAYKGLVRRVSGNLLACKGCDIEAFCAGGCAADAMAADKSIFRPARNCDFERGIFKALAENFILQ